MKLWCEVLIAGLKNEIDLGNWTPFEQAHNSVYLFDREFPKPEPVTVNDLKELKGLANEPEKESEDVLKYTHLWYYEFLPKDIARKATANTKNNPKASLYDKHGSLFDALKNSFNWVKSPEGVEYWKEVSEKHCGE